MSATGLRQVLNHRSLKELLDVAKKANVSLFIGLENEDGLSFSRGNLDTARKCLQKADQDSRRVSDEWIPQGPKPSLSKPLHEMQNDHNLLRDDAAAFVRFLRGGKPLYGQGEFFMWNYEVPVNSLVLSAEILRAAGYTDQNISVEKVIPWCNIKKSFGTKPAQKSFLVNISWTKTFLLFLEICYQKLRLDPRFPEPKSKQQPVPRRIPNSAQSVASPPQQSNSALFVPRFSSTQTDGSCPPAQSVSSPPGRSITASNVSRFSPRAEERLHSEQLTSSPPARSYAPSNVPPFSPRAEESFPPVQRIPVVQSVKSVQSIPPISNPSSQAIGEQNDSSVAHQRQSVLVNNRSVIHRLGPPGTPDHIFNPINPTPSPFVDPNSVFEFPDKKSQASKLKSRKQQPPTTPDMFESYSDFNMSVDTQTPSESTSSQYNGVKQTINQIPQSPDMFELSDGELSMSNLETSRDNRTQTNNSKRPRYESTSVKLDNIINSVQNQEKTMSDIVSSPTLQILSFNIDLAEKIQVKISDGEFWIPAEVSKVYKPYFGNEIPVSHRLKQFSIIKIMLTKGHAKTNDLFIDRLQLLSSSDKIIGNPIPLSDIFLNHVTNNRNMNCDIPVLSQDVRSNVSTTDMENSTQLHDKFLPSSRTISSMTDKDVYKRGQNIKPDSIVSLKIRPFGWTYWIKSQNTENKVYSVNISWPSTLLIDPSDSFQFDCTCPFSLPNVTMCKHTVFVLLHIGKR